MASKFVVERKSGQDLYGTLLQGHKRFKRQILRAEKAGIQMVVYVECTKQYFLALKFPGGAYRKCPGAVLSKIIHTVSTRYNLEFVWCRNRTELKKAIIKRLRQEEKL